MEIKRNGKHTFSLSLCAYKKTKTGIICSSSNGLLVSQQGLYTSDLHFRPVMQETLQTCLFIYSNINNIYLSISIYLYIYLLIHLSTPPQIMLVYCSGNSKADLTPNHECYTLLRFTEKNTDNYTSNETI